MSWRERLATYDDATLELLASVGALRRVKKGKLVAEIVDASVEKAHVRVGAHDVRLMDAPLDRATCSCPAGGVCVHILASVLAFRQPETVAVSALDELDAISVDAALHWAGRVAKRKALQWLSAHPDASSALVVESSRSSVELRLDADASCRYVAHGGLDGVVCNAPSSRRKAVILCCLLAYRAQKGEEIDVELERDAQPRGLSSDERGVIAEIKQQLRRLIAAGLGHAGDHLPASLRGLAWSSRGGRLPRLSTQLHQLCGELNAFRDGAGDSSSGRVLAHASTTWRICDELEKSEHPDPLRGVFRRTYELEPVRGLWAAGLSRYETSAGARGMTLVFVELDSERILHLNIGRAGEAARTFDFEGAWHGSIGWKDGGSPASILGEVVHLHDAMLSHDDRLSASQRTRVVRREPRHEHRGRLLELGHTSWLDTPALLRELLRDRGVGYLLLRPARLQPMGLDEQARRWFGIRSVAAIPS